MAFLGYFRSDAGFISGIFTYHLQILFVTIFKYIKKQSLILQLEISFLSYCQVKAFVDWQLQCRSKALCPYFLMDFQLACWKCSHFHVLLACTPINLLNPGFLNCGGRTPLGAWKVRKRGARMPEIYIESRIIPWRFLLRFDLGEREDILKDRNYFS